MMEHDGVDNPWPAFSDLLAATTLLFLVLFAVIAIPAIKRGEESRARESSLDTIQVMLERRFASRAVEVSRVGDYVLVRIPENATFPARMSDLPTLKEEGKLVLREVGEYLSDAGTTLTVDQVQVVGHTSREGSAEVNWNLSAARAATVARFLVDSAGLSPCKVTALGRSRYYPVDPAATRGGLRINPGDRRIELEIRPVIPGDSSQARRREACVEDQA